MRKYSITAALLGALALSAAIQPAFAEPKTMRAVMHAPLANLDPMNTGADITLYHGMLVYDTLFSWDENLQPQPQMVDKYTISDDQLTYTFTLRPGLKWHDGQPVKAEDSVASIKRWWGNDNVGQQLQRVTKDITVVDDTTFKIELKERFGYTIDALAKSGSNIPVMMPKRLADTPVTEAVTEAVGSGPFRFVKEEWVPGSKAVYVKNEDYQPRAEPANSAAGGKVVNIDRLEFIVITDQQTAQSALINGEVDYVENLTPDFLKALEGQPNIKVENTSRLGSQGIIRMNHTQPPFNNSKMRQGLLTLVDQETYLSTMFGDPKLYQACASIFVCGTPLASDSGAKHADVKDRVAEAKRLFEEAGYKGETIALLHPSDSPTTGAAVLVTAHLMREAGLNVDVQSTDWATLIARRSNRGTPAEGGWSIFQTSMSGLTASNPLTNLGLPANCEAAWFGWPCDEKLEQLRRDYSQVSDLGERKKLASLIQERAFEVVPYIPYGQWIAPIAYRADRIEGILPMHNFQAFWNVKMK